MEVSSWGYPQMVWFLLRKIHNGWEIGVPDMSLRHPQPFVPLFWLRWCPISSRSKTTQGVGPTEAVLIRQSRGRVIGLSPASISKACLKLIRICIHRIRLLSLLRTLHLRCCCKQISAAFRRSIMHSSSVHHFVMFHPFCAFSLCFIDYALTCFNLPSHFLSEIYKHNPKERHGTIAKQSVQNYGLEVSRNGGTPEITHFHGIYYEQNHS